VVKLASQALAKKSKDLQLAAWLAEGLLHREGIAGLRKGMELTVGLLEDFWDHVNPPIEDGDTGWRAGPLHWLGSDALKVAIQSAPLTARGFGLLEYRQSLEVPSQEESEVDSGKREARETAEAEGRLTPEKFGEAFGATPKAWYKELDADLKTLFEVIGRIDHLGDERFTDDAPSFADLRRALESVHLAAHELLDRKLEEDPDPPELEAVTEAGEEGGAPASHAAPAAGGSGGMSPEPTSADDAAKRVAAAARFLRQEDATNPAPYLMVRGLRWGEMRAGGGGVDVRLLAAPPTDVRTRLKTLLLDEAWPQLLHQAEEIMATPFGRGWLDLQRYALTALDALGSDYLAVRKAIRGSLEGLLEDLPELPDQTLMDDTPTANRETLQWLRGEGLLDRDGDGEREEISSHRDPFELAMRRVKAGETQEAIQLLMRAVQNEKSERARFLRRSQATRLLVDAGHEAVAMPMLKEMMAEIQEHTLDQWEDGSTVALPLGLLYTCLERLEDHSMDRDEIYQRVCRLDPLLAMDFRSSGQAAEATRGAQVSEAGVESEGEGV
jgi:type VI secretion system protein ImpA